MKAWRQSFTGSSQVCRLSCNALSRPALVCTLLDGPGGRRYRIFHPNPGYPSDSRLATAHRSRHAAANRAQPPSTPSGKQKDTLLKNAATCIFPPYTA